MGSSRVLLLPEMEFAVKLEDAAKIGDKVFGRLRFASSRHMSQ